MKLLFKSALWVAVLVSTGTMAQDKKVENYLTPEKYQRNVFEDPKTETPAFDGVKVKVGGDFALQFQGLNHWNEANITMYDLKNDFNLPTANMDVNAYLADGVKLHLRTYLSARHHNEAWVKGGHLQIDKLDFIAPGFMANVMKYARLRFGLDEVNYGDTHFRRSDNAEVINNPFVGNYIMDSFTTEVFGEGSINYNGFIGSLGISNGKLNQVTPTTSRYNKDNALTFFGKVGYDKQVDSDLRIRITGSFYTNHGTTTGTYLYSGDRAGSRYYFVMLKEGALIPTGETSEDFASQPSTGRFNPGLKENLAFQINPFVKYQGFEFFGVIEQVSGYATSKRVDEASGNNNGKYNQYAAEVLYRFGENERFYIGGRYNTVSGKKGDKYEQQKINRLNLGAGWFMTKNILAKLEYVDQKYSGDGFKSTIFQGGQFKGLMFEAAISF